MKYVSATILGILVLFGAWYVLTNPMQASKANMPAAATQSALVQEVVSQTSGSKKKPGEYTLTDVSAHADSTSCWSVINGAVYDLTSWIDQHPGGRRRILSICGRDGSEAFNNQHTGNSRVEEILATMKIGVLQ